MTILRKKSLTDTIYWGKIQLVSLCEVCYASRSKRDYPCTRCERILSCELDLSSLDFYGAHPICEPVTVVGEVRNRAGMLELEATLSSNLHLHCDSCGKPYERVMSVPVRRLLATELENEEDDEIILLSGSELDVDEVMTDEFIFAMDTKHLCSEDCKGRCPLCGADLNEGPCQCKPAADPRFAVLAQLLDSTEQE